MVPDFGNLCVLFVLSSLDILDHFNYLRELALISLVFSIFWFYISLIFALVFITSFLY